jgi:hypothetical protein
MVGRQQRNAKQPNAKLDLHQLKCAPLLFSAHLCCCAGVVPQDEGADGEEAAARSSPAWRLRSVSGLLARSVADLALGLDAVAGQHDQDPL